MDNIFFLWIDVTELVFIILKNVLQYIFIIIYATIWSFSEYIVFTNW